MTRSKRLQLALGSIVVLLTVAGCDETTEVLNPMDPTLEPGLDHTLRTTVRPVLTGLRVLGDLLPAATANCADTTSLCGPDGWATCTGFPPSVTFNLTFEDCYVGGHVLDGAVTAHVSAPASYVILTNLRVDDSPPITGEGLVNPPQCELGGDYRTSSGRVNGHVFMCESDPFPTGEWLSMEFSYYSASGNLDGSKDFLVRVFEGEEQVADCVVDLSTMKSTCHRL